jgi:GxxExxY protein
MDKHNFPHGELTGTVIEAFHETHTELGSGFSEKVCCSALVIVLLEKKLQVAVEVPIDVQFHGRLIGRFFADVVVNDTVLLEIKAAPSLEGYAQAQVLNYLKAAGGGVGLLLNFGRYPQHKRLVMGDAANSLPNLRRCPPVSLGEIPDHRARTRVEADE